MTTYRVYLTTAMATDELTAIVGDNEFPLSLATTTSLPKATVVLPRQTSVRLHWASSPLAFDSWVTIGLDLACFSRGW